ncbi:MAG: NAD-dependent succinate-semialdehyde dehydrogenase [Simkaniaceae bacterium]|nr:NAD-dependent succinate-semialdehyde dehydrogenase [Simkaniaceae bacterium]
MLQLKDPSLLKTDSYVNGDYLRGHTRFQVDNPFNGEVVATLSEATRDDTKGAIASADVAFTKWRHLAPNERGAYLERWAALIRDNRDDCSSVITHETGKPLEQATHELMGAIEFLEFYAQEGLRLRGSTLPIHDPNRRLMTIKQPVGPVAVITPWNFPFVIPIQKCAPALSAGCTVVLKPAEDTPLSSLLLAELARRAELPPGIFNVVVCRDPEPIGIEFTSNPLIRKVTFTGSTEVGKVLFSASGKTVKNVCMELGGNCPAIIFNDADLDKAVESTFWFKFYNTGQCCNNINRLFVHDDVHDKYVAKFHAMIGKYLKMGSGMEPTVNIGPLINAQGIDKVDTLVTEAKHRGAATICGGKRAVKSGPLFYEPTLLTNATDRMNLYTEELFGPVLPCYRFTSDEEVIERANNTRYGLAAYLYTSDMGRAFRTAEALEAGSVGINTHEVSTTFLPFGGWKESGVGRENTGNLDEYCEVKSVVFGNIGGLRP